MKSLILAFLILSISCFAQQNEKKGTIKIKKVETDTTIYSTVEEMPGYPGGDQALFSFISSNMTYPDSAKFNGISGTCYITFTINTDGNVSNVRILRGVAGCPECDLEALRVILSMPKWLPAKNKGRPVRVQYSLPIKFILR